MDQEIAATEDLMAATEEKIAEAQGNFDKYGARLNAFGAQYDEAGRITNYDEMHKREIDLLNAAQATGDEATIEAAEKRYEDFESVCKTAQALGTDIIRVWAGMEKEAEDYTEEHLGASNRNHKESRLRR